MTKKIRIVTHNSGYHADDVFGVATLSLLLGEEHVEVLRSRDPEIIASGDYVLDVGSVYDPATHRFDHHQEGGAGKRENGIPYASFGLIWKEYGEQLAGSKESAQAIDASLVQSIDGPDNGVDIVSLTHARVAPYTVGHFLANLGPAWGEEGTYDEGFFKAVAVARIVLEREIVHTSRDLQAKAIVETAYQNAPDKKLIVIETTPALSRFHIVRVLSKYPDPLYAVRNHEDRGAWQVVGINVDAESFAVRKPLPTAWAGKHDAELAAITGVPDAYFCHNGRFMCLARSKEGAMMLAQKAMKSL